MRPKLIHNADSRLAPGWRCVPGARKRLYEGISLASRHPTPLAIGPSRMERHGFWPLGLSLFLRFPGLDSFRHVLIELRVRIVGKSWRCWSVHNAYIRQWLSSRTRRALVGLRPRGQLSTLAPDQRYFAGLLIRLVSADKISFARAFDDIAKLHVRIAP